MPVQEDESGARERALQIGEAEDVPRILQQDRLAAAGEAKLLTELHERGQRPRPKPGP